MKEVELRTRLLDLLNTHRTGTLGTLSEQGWPYVSMTPFAVDFKNPSLLIHVSELGAHTRYLLKRPQASFMVCAREEWAAPVHALPRVTFQVEAEQLVRNSPPWEVAREAYLRRFPDVEFMMDFTDFHLFRLNIVRVRQVTGFGAAKTLDDADVRRWLASDRTDPLLRTAQDIRR